MHKDLIILLAFVASVLFGIWMLIKGPKTFSNTTWVAQPSGQGPMTIRTGPKGEFAPGKSVYEKAKEKGFDATPETLVIKKTTSDHTIVYTTGSEAHLDPGLMEVDLIPEVKY